MIFILLLFLYFLYKMTVSPPKNVNQFKFNVCSGSYLWDYQTNQAASSDKILSNTIYEGRLRYRCKCNHFPFLPYQCVKDYCNDENIYGIAKFENEKCHCSQRRTYSQRLASLPCTMCPWMVISDTVMKGYLKCQTKNSSGNDLMLPLCPPQLYDSDARRACIPFDIFYSIK